MGIAVNGTDASGPLQDRTMACFSGRHRGQHDLLSAVLLHHCRGMLLPPVSWLAGLSLVIGVWLSEPKR